MFGILEVTDNPLNYSGEIDRPGEFCYNMSALYHLTKMDCCPARFFDRYSYSRTFLDLFLSFNLVFFFLQLLSAHWEIWIVIAPVSIDFPSNPKVGALFYCAAYDYSRADWDDLWSSEKYSIGGYL